MTVNLSAWIKHIEEKKLNVEGIVVQKRGEKLAEHRWIPDAPKHIWSVSKSFASIGVGMMIDEGKLSLETKVVDILPVDNPSARLKALTLRHLLTMNSGYIGPERPDTVKAALSRELTKDPGEMFFYDSTCTFLASAMASEVSGRKVRDILVDRLFRPLGIPDPAWKESGDGYTYGGFGLEVTTANMAVFGEFLLRRGMWKGTRLVSESWIDGATRTQVPTAVTQNGEDWNLGYGFQFWTCRHGAFRCDGKNGQYIVVIPRIEAVIAVTSEDTNMKPILWSLWDYILPQLE